MLAVNFTPFPGITTDRLTLRQLTRADAPALYAMRSDPQIMRFIPRPLATSVEEVWEYIDSVNQLIGEHKLINWGITLGHNSLVIGTIGFFNIKPEHYRAEIGYMLHPGFQGRGLMQQALQAVLHYGFDTLKLHSVEAIIDPKNEASARLLERNQFAKEGHFKENEYWDGKFLDTVFYSLLEPKSR